MPVDANGRPIPLSFLDTSSVQVLDGASASAATTAFTDSFTAVLITAPEAFHLERGSSPTATTSSTYLPAGLYETVLEKDDKIAVIKATASTAGAVWVTPYKGH